jgi:heme/copper-type cytochrome/quinol oxidase subunit 2
MFSFLNNNNIMSFVYETNSPSPSQMFFGEGSTINVLATHILHNDAMVLMLIICFYVLWVLIRVSTNFTRNTSNRGFLKSAYSFRLYHSKYEILEFLWSGLPMVIIFLIGYPSFALLYSLEEKLNPEINYKIIGNQWYWSYEYKLLSRRQLPLIESYMQTDLSENSENPTIRLLSVDQSIQFPINVVIRLLITSTDVLHSWAVPAFGIKVDACPGRLNVTTLYVRKEGVFYGQCSEICGVNHGFMPICVQATDRLAWAVENISNTDTIVIN